MEEEKELELTLDKVYTLPKFKYIYYKDYCLAIAPEVAKWIMLENNIQLEILKEISDKKKLEDIFAQYEDYEDEIISVLTQIEAKHLENTDIKSVFSNTRLHLHLTNKCNLRCPHCYMESGKEYVSELTTDEIKKLCDDFKDYGGTDVSLTGGEPTTREDFFEIAEYIHSLGMRLSIFTNGFFWDDEKVKRISALNLDGVQISIDGYNEETNATIRGKGVFEKALNAVDLFVQNGIFVKVAVTAPYEIIKDHTDEYVSFSKNLIEKYREENIQINYSYFLMPGRNLNAEKIQEIKEEYYALVDGVVRRVYENIDEESFVSNINDCKYDSCGYGGLNVMANGDFYLCDRIPDVNKSGNIRTMNFADIYKIMKIAEEKGRIDNFKPCNSCELKYICGGGCRAEHFKDFTMIDDIHNVNFEKIAPRKCDKAKKEKIYDMMIQTNERFFY